MPESKSLVVYIPTDMHTALKIKSAAIGVPMTKVVRGLIHGWMDGKLSLPAGATSAPPGEEVQEVIARVLEAADAY